MYAWELIISELQIRLLAQFKAYLRVTDLKWTSWGLRDRVLGVFDEDEGDISSTLPPVDRGAWVVGKSRGSAQRPVNKHLGSWKLAELVDCGASSWDLGWRNLPGCGITELLDCKASGGGWGWRPANNDLVGCDITNLDHFVLFVLRTSDEWWRAAKWLMQINRKLALSSRSLHIQRPVYFDSMSILLIINDLFDNYELSWTLKIL